MPKLRTSLRRNQKPVTTQAAAEISAVTHEPIAISDVIGVEEASRQINNGAVAAEDVNATSRSKTMMLNNDIAATSTPVGRGDKTALDIDRRAVEMGSEVTRSSRVVQNATKKVKLPRSVIHQVSELEESDLSDDDGSLEEYGGCEKGDLEQDVNLEKDGGLDDDDE